MTHFPTFILSIALLEIGTSSYSDVQHASYDNLAETRASGAIKRGWDPDWLPETTTQISETHNLDTNALTIHAFIEADEIGRFYEHCSETANVTKPPFKADIYRRLEHASIKISCRNDRTGDLSGLVSPEGEFLLWTATTP